MLSYRDSGGTLHRFDTRAQGGALVMGPVEALGWSWEADESFGWGRPLSREASAKHPLKVADIGGGGELSDLARVFERDMSAGTPGLLVYEGWERACYVTSGEADIVGPHLAVAATFGVTFVDRAWSRAHATTFDAAAERHDGADFSLDLPTDLGSPAGATEVVVPDGPPSDVRIVFEGPASAPWCEVGGVTYGADVELRAGDRLTIDTASKTVEVHEADGTKRNAFPSRIRTRPSFPQQQPGRKSVYWPRTFPLLVEVKESAGWPWR